MADAIALEGRSEQIHVQSAVRPVFLGSYRMLLAFMVFCGHSVWPLAQTVTRADIGPIAILSFFTVSGYLIAFTMEANYTQNVWRFLINRFLRIYPTFWISMIVALVILSTGTTYMSANFYLRGWTWDNIIRCILIVPAYGDNATWGPEPVGWTLQVEVCFYLVIAALYFCIRRLSNNTRHILALCFWSACLIGQAVIISTMNLRWSNALLFIPFFVAGVMAAMITRKESVQPGTLVGAEEGAHPACTFLPVDEAKLLDSYAFFDFMGLGSATRVLRTP
jgi:peptidoglycan/LPS O-acetylase OafA/YrhL